MRKFFSFFTLLSILCSCGDRDGNAHSSRFEYTALENFPHVNATLSPGTPVRVIGFSGGGEIKSKDSVYAYEFLCITDKMNDTLKIFSTLISVDNTDNPQVTYTKPNLFDGDKHIYDAIYDTIDSKTEKLLLMAAAMPDPGNPDPAVLTDSTRTIRRMVVLNKSIPLLLEARFKVAFGSLHFKKQPW